MSKDVYPPRNLGDTSEQWGREIEKRIDELADQVERTGQKTRAVMRQSNAAVPGSRLLIRSIDPSKLTPDLWAFVASSHDRSKYAVETVDGKNTVFRDPNTPPPPSMGHKEGDVWFQPKPNGDVTIWTWVNTPSGGEWRKEVVDEDSISETIKQAIEDAQDQADFAVIAANGKNTNYTGPTPPTAPDEGFLAGDLWFDTSGNGAVVKIWNGTTWAVEQFGSGSLATGTIVAGDGIIGSLNAGIISAGTLDADRIGARTIVGSKLVLGTIDTSELADDAVQGTVIKDGAITTGKIAANAITSNELSANSVIAGKIASDAITTNELAAGAITAKHTITGALFQTDSAIDKGIKFSSGGLIAYDQDGNITVSINALTGAGVFTGDFVAGTPPSTVALTDNVTQWMATSHPGAIFQIETVGALEWDEPAVIYASNSPGDDSFQGLHLRGPKLSSNPSALTNMTFGRNGHFGMFANGGGYDTSGSISFTPSHSNGFMEISSSGILSLSGRIAGNSIINGLGGSRSLSGDTREYVTVTYGSPVSSGSRRVFTTFRGAGKIIMGVNSESGSSFQATVWNVHPSGNSTYQIGYLAVRT